MKPKRSNRISSEALRTILYQLREENKKALLIAKLITKREEIKLFQLWITNELPLKEAKIHSDKLFSSCKKLYSEVKQVFRQIKPEPVPTQQSVEAPQIQPQPRVRVANVSNDVEFLVSTSISALLHYGFKINDFVVQKISTINEKIRKIKTGKRMANQKHEKIVSLEPLIKKPKPLDFSKFFLIKRQSINACENLFLEKLDKNQVFNERRFYRLDNFTSQDGLNRRFSSLNERYSHCNLLPISSENPVVYCGEAQIMQANPLVEMLKKNRYSNLFNFYNHEILDHNPVLPHPSENIEKKADQFVNNLNLSSKLKIFLKKKKKL